MYILSIDGGGIRGRYAAHIIKRIATAFKTNFSQKFDFICGTSAGAILAAGLALDLPIEKIVTVFAKENQTYFTPTGFSVGGILREKYDIEPVRELLGNIFGDATFADTKTKLMITATDIGNAKTHLFKSYPSKQYLRDKDVKIADVVLASCAAPIYFKPVHLDPYLLIDGGMWATNPSTAAVAEAVHLGHKLDEIKLLSVGTGLRKICYSLQKKDRSWGLATVWGIRKLAHLLITLQVQADEQITNYLLSKQNIVRLNFESEDDLNPDKVKLLDDLKSKADEVFTSNANLIEQLLIG